jgi:ABC-2 type transport system ATP-binding protein
MTHMIQATGVVKRFGATTALDRLELFAEQGVILAVLGPNGAGKTTFVRCIATLLQPDAGTLRVFGHDVAREPHAVQSSIGLAGQFAAVEPTMTGRENLEMVARLFGQDRATARANSTRVLAQLGLVEDADRLVRTYSGGMRRKLDLGASLVGRRACCCWMSRPPGWTQAAASTCGTPSDNSSSRAPTCCSPPSTWRRPTGSPTRS